MASGAAFPAPAPGHPDGRVRPAIEESLRTEGIGLGVVAGIVVDEVDARQQQIADAVRFATDADRCLHGAGDREQEDRAVAEDLEDRGGHIPRALAFADLVRQASLHMRVVREQRDRPRER